MSFLHHRKLVELIKDPSSGELSMSRLMLPCILLLDAAWAYAAVKGWPPKEALVPVSSMLGVCTGSICGVYGLSTMGGSFSAGMATWVNRGDSTKPPSPPPPQAKPAPPGD